MEDGLAGMERSAEEIFVAEDDEWLRRHPNVFDREGLKLWVQGQRLHST